MLDSSNIDCSYKPLPGSRKVYKTGTIYTDIRVPAREILQSSASEAPPLHIYDTSGPYTDPKIRLDITKGLPKLRDSWIAGRRDVEVLEKSSSVYRRKREKDPSLNGIRFPGAHKPFRTCPGKNVIR